MIKENLAFNLLSSPSLLKRPEVHPNAKLLRSPTPIVHVENNWPLLTMAKGFFDGAMSSKPGASDLAASAVMEEDGDWGEDAELDLDEGMTEEFLCCCCCCCHGDVITVGRLLWCIVCFSKLSDPYHSAIQKMKAAHHF